MIDISDINMIKVISEVGSVNKAAEILCVSQPTLSKKVARLEQKIKMELFYRDNVGMIPTQAAKFLLSESNNLQQQLAVIERQLELMADSVGGKVTIGVGPIIEQGILPKVLLDYAENNYQFDVSVTTMSAEALLDSLKHSQIDLAIGPFMASDVPQEFHVPYMNYGKIVLAVRPGHALATKSKITLNELLAYKTITPNIPKSLGNQVTDLLTGRTLEPNIVCESYNMAKNIVKNSDYVTGGPEELFYNEFSSGELIKVEFIVDVLWQCRCLVKPESMLLPMIKEVVDIFAQYMLPMDSEEAQAVSKQSRKD